jgi:hypothetical protein
LVPILKKPSAKPGRHFRARGDKKPAVEVHLKAMIARSRSPLEVCAGRQDARAHLKPQDRGRPESWLKRKYRRQSKFVLMM